MKVLVTGAAGFIGTNLTDELTSHGHEVWEIDLKDGDLRIPNVARHLIGPVEPDVVIHLAAQVGREKGEDDPRYTIESNALMTAYVAQATAEAGARLIYTSTSEVYGDWGETEVREESIPMRLPHNLYGLSKRWGEEAAALYCPDGLQVIRPSMPYGPGAPPGRGRRAMDNMLWQAENGLPIPVHRGAERSWCWIGDVVRGFRLVLESGIEGAFNVGRSDDPVTMLQIARMSCVMADAPLDLIQVIDPPARQTLVKRLSTNKLRALGWTPTVELEEGMSRLYWEWIRHFDKRGEWDPERHGG